MVVMILLGIGLYMVGAAGFYGWMVRFATPMEEDAPVRLRLVDGGMQDDDGAQVMDRRRAA